MRTIEPETDEQVVSSGWTTAIAILMILLLLIVNDKQTIQLLVRVQDKLFILTNYELRITNYFNPSCMEKNIYFERFPSPIWLV